MLRRGSRSRGARPRGGGRGGFRGRGAMRGRGRGRGQGQPKGDFNTSRVQDLEEVSDNESEKSENLSLEEDNLDQTDDATSDGSDEERSRGQSYISLLQVLNANTRTTDINGHTDRSTKRRKLDDSRKGAEAEILKQVTDNIDDTMVAGLQEPVDEDDETHVQDFDSEDEDVILRDPFEQHYASIEEITLRKAIVAEKAGNSSVRDASVTELGVRKHVMTYEGYNIPPAIWRSKHGPQMKKRLSGPAAAVMKATSPEVADLSGEIFAYRDVLYAGRTTRNVEALRDVSCLHALNHIFKTRDRVLKNNAKLSSDETGDTDLRDQGFTRPKVLVLLPTKQACARYIDSVVKLSEPDQQENKSRFLDTFSQDDDESWNNKPEDFRETFGGNHEEDFRIGLKFTRKTIKFFSGFYNSDIIFASPLGLMRTITTGGGATKDGKKKGHDSDFLSSIEIAIVDQTNALEMQNWAHVEYVFSQLNLIPKESNGCDFSRARNWYLDGNARFLRQTIILASHLTPSINSLASQHLHNFAGRAKYTPVYAGAMVSLPANLPMTIMQSFLRFDSPSPLTDSDSRFKFFASSILPAITSNKKGASSGTLLFVPTYADFTRLRNHFSTSAECTNLSFGVLSEYTNVRDVARARSHFLSGRHSVMLYTERAHHHFRYRIRGVNRLFFYGVPDNPVFWPELIALLGMDSSGNVDDGDEKRNRRDANKQGRGLVRAMFSKWDAMKLERIVGTERIGRLVSEKQGDVFDFA